MFCPYCGTENDPTARFCSQCGKPLPRLSADGTQCDAPAPRSEATNRELYAACIGPEKLEYYLPIFERFDRNGIRPTLNLPALFVTFFWLIYRRMRLAAVVYLILPLPLMILIELLVRAIGGPGLMAAVSPYLMFATLGVLWIVVPMYANALYYQHCRKRIADVRIATDDPADQLARLSRKGGGQTWGVVVALVLYGLLYLGGIFLAIAIPAYMDYVTIKQSTVAYQFGRQLSVNVGQYMVDRRRAPATFADAGVQIKGLPPQVASVNLERDGVIRVVIGVGSNKGKTLLLTPTYTENGILTWKCTSPDIKRRMQYPKACRPPKK